MDEHLRDKLAEVLHDMKDEGIDAVLLYAEEDVIQWMGNVPRDLADAMVIKVGLELKEALDKDLH
jgi:hypothetical protein